MDTSALTQEIDMLIATIGADLHTARPEVEHNLFLRIRQLLEQTRAERTAASRALWEAYLPYAAQHCFSLSKLEPGWEDDLEYFASENGQFWVDHAIALLEEGEISGLNNALKQLLMATRMMHQDRIAQVDLLLQGLELALEISDKKQVIALYEEADKLYRKHLSGGTAYTGSAWLPRIKKMGRKLAQSQEKLRRYYAYASSVSVSLEADSAEDLQRVLDYLQENLLGKVKITRRSKPAEGAETAGESRFRVRVKISLE
jgi:hypothetical protein